MKKNLISKLLGLIILILFMVSSVNYIEQNKLDKKVLNKEIARDYDTPQILYIPIFKINNLFIEFKYDYEKKVLSKGEISIGRPSGGD